MSPSAKLSDLSRAELEALLVELLGDVSELKGLVAAQRDEIARLKGLPGRATIKPSGMEKGTQPKPPGGKAKRGRGGGPKTSRRTIHEDRVIRAVAPVSTPE